MKVPRSAVKGFEKFHGHAVNRIRRLNLPAMKVLIRLGQAVAVEYSSNKPIGKLSATGRSRSRVYRHLFGPGVELFTDSTRRCLIVTGGKFRVTDWLRG